jgi:hypothetical protein
MLDISITLPSTLQKYIKSDADTDRMLELAGRILPT